MILQASATSKHLVFNVVMSFILTFFLREQICISHALFSFFFFFCYVLSCCLAFYDLSSDVKIRLWWNLGKSLLRSGRKAPPSQKMAISSFFFLLFTMSRKSVFFPYTLLLLFLQNTKLFLLTECWFDMLLLMRLCGLILLITLSSFRMFLRNSKSIVFKFMGCVCIYSLSLSVTIWGPERFCQL